MPQITRLNRRSISGPEQHSRAAQRQAHEEPAQHQSDDDTIGSDILRGAIQIARFTGLTPRNAFFKLQNGFLPGVKEGALWVSSKTALRRHYLLTPAISNGPEPTPRRPISRSAENTEQAPRPRRRAARA
jgi:hypothetical protein